MRRTAKLWAPPDIWVLTDSFVSVQGQGRGKGGVSLEPSLSAPANIYFPAGSHLPNPRAPLPKQTDPDSVTEPPPPPRTRLPREEGTDIGISSPVPLSDEAVGIISKLRNMKDKDEDYSRWRDVVFRAKNAEALNPASTANRSEGLNARASKRAKEMEEEEISGQARASAIESGSNAIGTVLGNIASPESILSSATRLEPLTSAPPTLATYLDNAVEDDSRYCPECYLPMMPDPRPETLFIFLHAWRYTTKEWSFKTDLPFWASKGYRWKRDDDPIKSGRIAAVPTSSAVEKSNQDPLDQPSL